MRTSDETYLHVETTGPTTAPVTAIFCHGFAVDLHTWDDQRPHLAGSNVRQVYYDHRAFGRSGPWPGGAVSIRQLAEDLAEVIGEHAPRGPIVLVGHSMGTLTIQTLAVIRPELFGARVVATVLVAAPSHGEFIKVGLPLRLHRPLHVMGPALLTLLARTSVLGLVGRLPFTFMARWAHSSFASVEQRRELAVKVAKNDLRMLAAYLRAVFDFEEETAFAVLSRVHTVVAGGALDRLVDVKGTRRLASLVHGAVLLEHPQCGHMIHNEVPDQLNRLLDGVLARYTGQAADSATTE